MTGLRLGLLLAGGLAYSVASYWMMLFHPSEPWAVPVLLVPLWLTGIGLAASCLGRWAATVVVALGLLFFFQFWRGQAGDPNWLYMLQHVSINALLCGWFGSTLRRGQLSLIGQFAERVHALTPGHVRYTAAVTRVWTLYFAAVAILSAVIYALCSFAQWTLFSNVVTPLGCMSLFFGEYLLRYRLHPEFERTRLIDAVRAFYSHPAPGAASRGEPPAP